MRFMRWVLTIGIALLLTACSGEAPEENVFKAQTDAIGKAEDVNITDRGCGRKAARRDRRTGPLIWRSERRDTFQVVPKHVVRPQAGLLSTPTIPYPLAGESNLSHPGSPVQRVTD